MHAPGVDGMNPALFMPVFPSEDGHRNPGVHEDRVDQPVEVNLERHFDLEKYDQWNDRLDEAQYCPELLRHKYIVIEDDRKAGIEHVDIGHHQVEGGEEEEIVLQQLHDSVQHHNTVPFDAFFEKNGDVPFRAVELALCPAFALAAGSHEAQRFFIINDCIMNPAGTDAVRQAFHGKFHIFCQAVAAPAVFLHDICRDAHACAAKAGGKAQVVLAQMPQMVDRPESNGKGTGYPGVRRVLRGKVALHDPLSFEETGIHDSQEVQMHQVVGIENTKSIVALIELENFWKNPVHGITLAYQFFIEPFKDVGPVLPCDFCRIICAVVRNNVDIVELFRIFQDFQVFKKVGQHHGFIVRRNDAGKFRLRCGEIPVFSMPHTAYGNHCVVNRKECHNELYRVHDEIEGVIHH